jgi:hypothetical protein
MSSLSGVLVVLAFALGIHEALARPGAKTAPLRPHRIPTELAEKAPVAQCTVTEILASNDKKGIDPRLEKFKAKLTKPPFSAWDTFKLLAETGAQAEKDKPTATKLATGGTLTLLLKDKLVSQGGKARLRFGVDIDSRDGKRTVSTVVVFDSGDSVLVAGEPFQGGTYILALSCTS